MKSIAIIGAGVGGCTTYLFLKKHLSPHIPDLEIHIYESYPPPPYLSRSHPKSPSDPLDDIEERPNLHSNPTTNVTTALGGGLGLSPNGIRVLKTLDPEIYARIKASSYETDAFGLQISSGRMLGSFPAGGKRYGNGTMIIMRAALHDAVLEKVDQKDISFERKVKSVVDGVEKAKIEFENGETVEADFVVGVDGVWGKTRQAIPESAALKAEYDGLVGIGAFLDEKTTRNILAELKDKKNVVLPKSVMTMTFGPSAFFGTVLDVSRLEKAPSKDGIPENKDLDRELPFAGWWSTFPMDPPPTSKTPFSDVKGKVLANHKGWTPLITALIENSGVGGSGEVTHVLPRWITPNLPKWTSDSGRILLAGDAAHCMPPDSGQGVSCAVEDAMTIGLLCEAIFVVKGGEEATDQGKLKKLCDLYTKLRKPRCEYIVAEARKRGDMKRELNVVEQTIRNIVMWAMCKIMPESMMDAFYSYDVETEVKKALNGETPAFKGKGKVVVKDE